MLYVQAFVLMCSNVPLYGCLSKLHSKEHFENSLSYWQSTKFLWLSYNNSPIRHQVFIIKIRCTYMSHNASHSCLKSNLGWSGQVVEASVEYLLKLSIWNHGLITAVHTLILPPWDHSRYTTCWSRLMEKITLFIIS